MRYLFVLLIFGLLTSSISGLAQELPTGQPALDFIINNPDDVAVMCSTTGADDSAVEHNADEPFALASTYKLVILAEMARQMDAGLIDPAEALTLAEVNAYWLPGTDGDAHQAWLNTLAPDQETVTLGEVAYAMIAFSSNAAPDYLLARLGTDGFSELFDLLGLEHTDLPASGYLGLYLALDNHETGPVDLATLTVETLTAERQRLETLYLTDADWRDAQQAYHAEKITALTNDPDAAQAEIERQAAYLAAFDFKSSAHDMLTVMEAAYHDDSLFSEETRQFMQSTLNWIMDMNPANRDIYTHLGTKGGSTPGILTAVWYVQPQGGETTTLAVFYRDLPLDLWLEWMTTGAQQELELHVVAQGAGCSIFSGL